MKTNQKGEKKMKHTDKLKSIYKKWINTNKIEIVSKSFYEPIHLIFNNPNLSLKQQDWLKKFARVFSLAILKDLKTN